jgi:protein-disulfide isomerase
MSVRRSFLLAALTGVVACRPSAPRAAAPAGPAPGADSVVAQVGEVRLTLAELDRKASGSLAQIRHDEYEARQRTLDQWVADTLIEGEARARSMTREALLKAEIEDHVKEPTPAQISEFYVVRGGPSSGYSQEQLTPQIVRALKEQTRTERRTALLDRLKAKATVRTSLVEPRTEVAVPADAPSLGPADARVTVVEFLDYECPYCHRVQETVETLLARNPGKVRFVHREYLIGKPRSLEAARAARCAGDQGKFWPYHNALLSGRPDMSDAGLKQKAASLGLDAGAFSTCLASDRHDASIREAAAKGSELGVSSTPTFFINGRRLVGAQPLESFQKLIDEELKGG